MTANITESTYVTFLKQVDDQISRFNGKRQSNNCKYHFWIGLQIFSGALASLILGLSLPETMTAGIKNAALFFATLASLSTLVQTQFQFKDNFIGYTWVVSQLRQLKAELEFNNSLSKLDASQLTNFHNRFVEILNDSNLTWKSRMAKVSEVEKAK